MMNNSTEEWNLIGATSWSHVNCQVDGSPQGFTNLFTEEFNDWVKTNTDL